MEEIKLDIIRIASYPNSINKFHLVYKDGGATGMVGVYSYDDNWYYLFKGSEKVKTKRRKDLENQKPYTLYHIQRKKHEYIKKHEQVQSALINRAKEVVVMEGNFIRDYNKEIQQFFGDRFTATPSMSRFEVMVDHFSKKFEISKEQVLDAYEKTYKLNQEGKADRFAGYFAAVCKGMSKKEYTQDQTMRYIEFNVKQRKDEQLEDFISKYEAGERRTFAPSFGITKKKDNELAYQTAKAELETRHNKSPLPVPPMDRSSVAL